MKKIKALLGIIILTTSLGLVGCNAGSREYYEGKEFKNTKELKKTGEYFEPILKKGEPVVEIDAEKLNLDYVLKQANHAAKTVNSEDKNMTVMDQITTLVRLDSIANYMNSELYQDIAEYLIDEAMNNKLFLKENVVKNYYMAYVLMISDIDTYRTANYGNVEDIELALKYIVNNQSDTKEAKKAKAEVDSMVKTRKELEEKSNKQLEEDKLLEKTTPKFFVDFYMKETLETPYDDILNDLNKSKYKIDVEDNKNTDNLTTIKVHDPNDETAYVKYIFMPNQDGEEELSIIKYVKGKKTVSRGVIPDTTLPQKYELGTTDPDKKISDVKSIGEQERYLFLDK
ncbi:hypothetical protein [Paraclostridium bifermentans]|uniref:hypothetical protein n=1 Tax=Paraclostridium bifermentans TaxID=1490 RepID=UPI001159DED4|nr:hypothetical protein [Paraclostridium bifermentans]TQO59329.1 hypothetical protein D5S05_02335 [Paraclostridium bifermentans]